MSTVITGGYLRMGCGLGGEGMEGGWKGGGSLGRDGECRVAVLGEPGVGKNALVARFVRGEFPLVRHQICSIFINMIFTQSSCHPISIESDSILNRSGMLVNIWM